MRSFGYITTFTSLTPGQWSCQLLSAFIDLHRHFCSELNFTEWAPPAAIANDQVPPPRSAVLTLPPPTLLATLQVLLREENANAAQRPEIPPQRNITREIMKQLFSVQPDAPLQRAGLMALAPNSICARHRTHSW